MTEASKRRNARRLTKAMEAVGFSFLLSQDRQTFGVLGAVWLPARMRRQVHAMRTEILELLCTAQVRNVVLLRPGTEPERRLSIN